MKTSRIISNISYNSLEHFDRVMTGLVDRGVIDWGYWIFHNADIDERKNHIHFVLKPSVRIDTSALKKEFDEFDINYPTKPLSCTSRWFYTSSMDDWLLYAIHYEPYLNSKGQKRNCHYSFDDIFSTDNDGLNQDIANIDLTRYNRLETLRQAVIDGIPFTALVQQGLVPIAQRSQYEFQYKGLQALVNDEVSHRVISHEDTEAAPKNSAADGFTPADDILF